MRDLEHCPNCEGSGYVLVDCKICKGTQWVGGRPGGELCCSGVDQEECKRCKGTGEWMPEIGDEDEEPDLYEKG